jgi:hypothetical protein
MAMRSSSCDSDSTPKPIGVIFPVKGWARNTAGTWVTFSAVAMPLSGRARREARHRAAVHAHGHHLDAVAGLEGLQRRREGVAVGAVAAEEEEQHVVAAQLGDRGLERSVRLLLVEHLQRLRVDRAALQRRVELGRGPGHALRHVGEVGGAVHHLHLQLHVAPHVGSVGRMIAMLRRSSRAFCRRSNSTSSGGRGGAPPGCSGGARGAACRGAAGPPAEGPRRSASRASGRTSTGRPGSCGCARTRRPAAEAMTTRQSASPAWREAGRRSVMGAASCPHDSDRGGWPSRQ